MKNNILDLGVVLGLDYKNPNIDAHHELQLLKSHPWLKSILEGAEIIAYGSKTLPEGGLYSLPKLYVGATALEFEPLTNTTPSTARANIS